jgi:threonine dehydrogenase-like Zn-dependent dehydrogenase
LIGIGVRAGCPNELAGNARCRFLASARSWRQGVDLVATGSVKIDVTRIFPLEQVAEAHWQLAARMSFELRASSFELRATRHS